MKVYGTPTGYHDGRHSDQQLVLVSEKDSVDSVRLELGVPLRHLNESGNKSLAYAQVDDETRSTLIEMEELRNSAQNQNDYIKLKQITRDLSDVLSVSHLRLSNHF